MLQQGQAAELPLRIDFAAACRAIDALIVDAVELQLAMIALCVIGDFQSGSAAPLGETIQRKHSIDSGGSLGPEQCEEIPIGQNAHTIVVARADFKAAQ